MKTVLISIFLFGLSCSLFSQEGKKYEVHYNGKQVTIKGDNLKILIGRNLKVKALDESLIKIRDKIKRDYLEKVETLEEEIRSNKLSFKSYTKQVESLSDEYEIASKNLEILKEEILAATLEDGSYLSRLAYVLIIEGKIDEAIDLLSEEELLGREYIQVQKYILLASSYYGSGDVLKSEKILLDLIKKYPYLDSFIAICNYYIEEFEYQKAALLLTSQIDRRFLSEKDINKLNIYLNYFWFKSQRRDNYIDFKLLCTPDCDDAIELQPLDQIFMDTKEKMPINLIKNFFHINRYDLIVDVLSEIRRNQIVKDKEALKLIEELYNKFYNLLENK